MTTAVTSLKRKNPKAPSEDQLPYWVEIQLVDEQGTAVGGIPWKAESHHQDYGRIEEFTHSGKSDADGLIRIDMPHGLELKLSLEADPLAKVMEKRPLRPGRDAETDSTVRQPAEDSGYIWHYAVLGELCRTTPSMIKLNEGEVWPPFHFPPGKAFQGFTLRTNELEKRHVIEICPFRAWELVLHHQKAYSIANAVNLGGAAYLAYSDDTIFDQKSIFHFFINQCQDLSRPPEIYKENNYICKSLVQDVPFSDRYYPPVFMDTSLDKNTTVSEKSEAQKTAAQATEDSVVKADGDTQLFYVHNTDKIIIAWRGTASLYDVGTDLAFAPVNTETCDIKKTQCTTLLPAGKVHDGFWSGYCRVERKFESELVILRQLVENLSLFICGHSLGGALALIHAAKLKIYNPILHTYGMPRTFTRDAVAQLSDITHFRHVNDSDPVPAVPPEANLDNELYRLWGPLGKTLGMLWSTGEALAYQAIPWGDCFWHHGNPVVFLTATQSRAWTVCQRDLPTPAGCRTLKKLLPVKAKLYLVPALAEQEMQDAGQKQKEFKGSLTKGDLDDIFPQGGNPARGFDATFGDHSMAGYMPYMNNKLLELIDKEGMIKNKSFTEHRYNIDLFKEQMEKEKNESPEKERERNEIFLNIEDLLKNSLSVTLATPCGNNTLVRFAHYIEEALEDA